MSGERLELGRFLEGRVHQGDAALLLPELPAGLFDAVLADPPYSSGGLWTGARRRPTVEKYSSWSRGAGFAGDTRDQRSYRQWCAWWLAQCYRVSKPSAFVGVFTDWRQLPTTVDALQMAGWTWRGILPWVKDVGRFRPAPGFAGAAEFVVWGAGPEFRGAPSVRGVLEGELVELPRWILGGGLGMAAGHLTEKPVDVLEQLMAPAPLGGLVLDPFAGSGTTGVAARRTGRRFLGFELDPVWCELANRRLGQTAQTAELPLWEALGADPRPDPLEGLEPLDRDTLELAPDHCRDQGRYPTGAIQVAVELPRADPEPGGDHGPGPAEPLGVFHKPRELVPGAVPGRDAVEEGELDRAAAAAPASGRHRFP
jgi:site-specific DNA-methyltransferase (adenine-specific)